MLDQGSTAHTVGMVTVDVWKLAQKGATYRSVAVLPCELWLVSSFLLSFGVVSKCSLGGVVAVLLGSTALTFKMVCALCLSHTQPRNACGSRWESLMHKSPILL